MQNQRHPTQFKEKDIDAVVVATPDHTHAVATMTAIKILPRSIGHRQEWIEGCKNGKQPECNFDYAGPLTEMVLLGNIALRFDQPVKWDSKNFKITNLSDANNYLHRDYKECWLL